MRLLSHPGNKISDRDKSKAVGFIHSQKNVRPSHALSKECQKIKFFQSFVQQRINKKPFKPQLKGNAHSSVLTDCMTD